MEEIPIAEAFSAAVYCHVSGAFPQAKQNYDALLEAGGYSRHADVLYLKGLLLCAERNFAEAEELIGQACAKDARIAWFHEILGAAYSIGQLRNIVRLFVADIALRPACRPFGAHRIDLPDVTLVCIDCATHNLGLLAIKNSLAQCRFGRALLLTDQDLYVHGVETIRIPTLDSLNAYSTFRMRELRKYIETSHALVIEWDGFVRDAKWWTDGFLDYDYIGARWWYEDGHNVGNGGFSLLSRKLLAALDDPAIVPGHPDDGRICRTYRPLLESKYGISFAPDAVAAQFSYERVASPTPTFGFHGAFNFLPVLDRQCAHFLIPSFPAYAPGAVWLTQLRDRLADEGYAAIAKQFTDIAGS